MKALIVEDEQAAASRLERMLKQLDPDLEILDVIPSVERALQWFGQNQMPDLIFMDIQLEDGQSFEILEKFVVDCPIIFTTAYDQYAIRAFQYFSIDYILKPYKEEVLERAYQKFRSLGSRKNKPSIDYEQLVNTLQRSPYRDRILVQLGSQLRSLSIEEVAYFFSRDKIVFLVSNDEKRYPTDFSLDQLAKMLDPRTFYRINRQYIVGIESIDQMFAYSKSRVKLILKPKPAEEVIVSTDRSPEFKLWLSGMSSG